MRFDLRYRYKSSSTALPLFHLLVQNPQKKQTEVREGDIMLSRRILLRVTCLSDSTLCFSAAFSLASFSCWNSNWISCQINCLTLLLCMEDCYPFQFVTVSLKVAPYVFSNLLLSSRLQAIMLEQTRGDSGSCTHLRYLCVHPLHPQLVGGDWGRSLQDDSVPPVHGAGAPRLGGAGGAHQVLWSVGGDKYKLFIIFFPIFQPIRLS